MEAFAIFLSVLLGFAVAEWRDGRDDAALRRSALDAFAQEIEANRARLVEYGTYHHWLVRQLEAGQRDGSIQTLRDVFSVEGVDGFRPVDFSHTAWQTATTTGALALVGFDTASALSETYDAQTEVETEQDRLRVLGLDALTSEDPPPAAEFTLLSTEFLSLEQGLLDRMNAALVAVAEAQGKASPPPVPVDTLRRDDFVP